LKTLSGDEGDFSCVHEWEGGSPGWSEGPRGPRGFGIGKAGGSALFGQGMVVQTVRFWLSRHHHGGGRRVETVDDWKTETVILTLFIQDRVIRAPSIMLYPPIIRSYNENDLRLRA
jgi:hypothetical protein